MLFEFSLQYLEQIWHEWRLHTKLAWFQLEFDVIAIESRFGLEFAKSWTGCWVGWRRSDISGWDLNRSIFSRQRERGRGLLAAACSLSAAAAGTAADCSKPVHNSHIVQFEFLPTEQADFLKSMSWYSIWHIFVQALCLHQQQGPQTAAPSHC